MRIHHNLSLPAALKTALLLGTLLASMPASAALKIFACEPEWGALAKEIGGSDVDVYTATTAQQDPHQIQPRPSLLARFRQSDLSVCTGAELEIGWLPVLMQSAGNPKIQSGQPGYFEASSAVTMLEVPTHLDRADGDVHPYGNPHIQTDPRNIGKVAKALAQRLADLDGAHAADYAKRAADFDTRWNAAIAKWAAEAAPLKDQPVITYHKEWAYLFDWLGIKLVGTLEPKPGIPPSAAHLQELLNGLKTQPAKMILYSAYQDDRAATWLSDRAKLAAVQLPFTVGGAKGTDDLFGLYQVTVDKMLAGLKASAP
jgi:zinc/manganese transport system substrate-binding protein